jgi:DNA-binding Xre family transcriptional regulator
MDTKKLKNLMAKKGFTVRGLAKAAGVPRNTIQLKLSNPKRKTTLKSVGKIAAALGVEPVDLLEDE